MRKYHFESIDSTSIYLKRNFNRYKNFTFVSSDYQSKGHGRENRVWESSKGDNLLFSILIKDKELIKQYKSLSIASAYVVFEFLKSLSIDNVFIKWPNDVYVNDKKICGVLLESISFSNEIESLILGVGLNVNMNNFKNLEMATSMFIETKKKYDINKLKKDLYKRFLRMLKSIKKGDYSYLNIVRKYNYLKNKSVYAFINDEKVLVEVIDINDDNTLKVEYKGNILDLSTGEITFNLN